MTPELAAERSQEGDDSEEGVERWVRQFYLKMAMDPELLSSGMIETFPCPNCQNEIRIELPPARGKTHPPATSVVPIAEHTCSWPSRGVGVAPPAKRRHGRCIFCDDNAIATSMSFRR